MSSENISADSAVPVGTSRPEPTLISVQTNDVPVRRESIAPSTESLGDLDSAVSTLAVSPLSPVERGHGVLAILRRMVHAESGSYNITAGLGRFLERMWSGPFIESLVRSIHLRAVALAEGRVGDGLDPLALVHDVRSFIEWYSLRRVSLQACRREGFVEADPDALFNLHIAHDVRRWGVDGMVVRCGLRFIARAHETVWFKVSARRAGEDVSVHPAWRTWRDETDVASVPSEGEADRFAALTPIRPLRQRCVVDQIEVFVPYAALDLPAGRHELDLEAGVYTRAGELIVSAVVPETVQIPESSVGGLVVPAPQALGVWSSDPVTGHEVVVTGSHVRFEGDPGWEERVVETRVDLTLVDFAGERLELEARLRHGDGTVVGVLDRPRGGTLEPCLARVALLPQQIVSKLSGVRVLIPLAELDLAPGRHRLFVETVVVTADGRIVCGAVEPVALDVVPRGSAERELSEPLEPAVASDAEINVGAIVVTPVSRNDQVMLDVGISVSTRDWESSQYRLLVSLECRDGTPICNTGAADRPVLRTVWFGGERRLPGEERVVRVSFDAREFARFLKIKGPAERDIVTRIVVANEVGRTIFETTRVVASDFAADVRAAMPPERSNVPVRTVDITLAESAGDRSGLKLLLTLNVHRFALQSDRCTVYYEFVDSRGEPYRSPRGAGELAGDVATVLFPFVGRAAQRRWYQTTVEIPSEALRAPGVHPAGVTLTVFSPRGEYWETVYHPFLSKRTPELNDALSRLTIRAKDGGPDSGGDSSAPPRGGDGSVVPGLLSKIRSALIG